MSVEGVTINDNIALGTGSDNGGGGVFNNGGTLRLINGTRISNNTATEGSGSGGGVFNAVGGNLFVNQAIINRNSANRAGGGIEDASGSGDTTSFVVINTTIDSNIVNNSPGNGGGIHVGGGGNMSISRSMVSNNVAGSEGGGLWNSGGGTMSVDRTRIMANSAPDGGGIYNDGGTLTVSLDTRIGNNLATGASGSGGGIFSVDGDVTVSNTRFMGNVANRAGGAVELVDGNYTSNTNVYMNNSAGNLLFGTPAPGNGGAFHVTGMEGTISFTLDSVVNNIAFNQGGGLWNQSGTLMTVDRVSILNNVVTNNGSDSTSVSGGGIYNKGILDVTRSTIARNRVDGTETSGGGITNTPTGDATIFASTISTNNTGGSGGAILNAGMLSVVNSTIAFNDGLTDGGINSTSASTTFTITGSILYGNDANNVDSDITNTGGGTITSNGFNLIGADPAGVFSAMSTDLIGVNPLLDALDNYGGPTLTHLVGCFSPALDAGNPDDNSADQRGRPVTGDSRDIGALERQLVCPTFQPEGDVAQRGNADELPEIASVFPNPSNGSYVTVRVPENFGTDARIRIIDANGRVIATRAVTAGRNQLSLEDLYNGTYTVQVIGATETQNLRLLIVK